LSNEEKTKDYENFEKGMIYMKILKKKGGVVEKRGEEETKSMRLWLVPSQQLFPYLHGYMVELTVTYSSYRMTSSFCVSGVTKTPHRII
jgi:hypothetical protein